MLPTKRPQGSALPNFAAPSVYYDMNRQQKRGAGPRKIAVPCGSITLIIDLEAMFKIRLLIASSLLFFLGDSRAADDSGKAAPKEPKTLSVFPLGGQRGTTIEVSVRGQDMEGTYAAWFERDGVEVRFLGLEEIREAAPDELVVRDPQAKQTELAGHRARLQFRIGEDARVGLHRFRVVTPRGMSNALNFQVVRDPVVLERDAEEQQAVQAPVVIAGTTKTNGELDLYSFQAEEGEQFHFQTFTSFPIYIPYSAEAELNLYAPTGSWFDPDRLLRLPWESRPLSWVPVLQSRRQGWGAQFAVFPMPTHRFKKAGRYLVSMGSFLGEGNPDFVYLLRDLHRTARLFHHHGPAGPSRSGRLAGAGFGGVRSTWRVPSAP